MKNVKNALAGTLSPTSLPWALWTWNGNISEDEVDAQAEALFAAGFGGIAVRPGRDMRPAYMSEEFLACLGRVLEAARKHKAGVRLADDFSVAWSGCIDDIIGESGKLRAEYLSLDREMAPAPSELEIEVLLDPALKYIAQAVRRINKTIHLSDVRDVLVPAGKTSFRWKAPGPEWRLLLYKLEPAAGPSGVGVMNVLNQKAVQSYIQNKLEVIKSAFSKYVPATFEGFITELPALRPGGGAIYWDSDIAVKYKSRYKREFMNQLPAMFLEAPAAERIRSQAYSFIANLIIERFSMVLDTWAKKFRISQWLLWPESAIYRTEGALIDAFVPTEGVLPALGLQNLDGSIENYPLLRAAADVNTNQFRRETVTVVGRSRSGFGASLQDIKREIDASLLAGPSRILIDGFYFNTDRRNTYKAPYNTWRLSPEWQYAPLLCAYSARAQEMIANMHSSREIAVLSPSTAIMGDYTPAAPAAANAGIARFRTAVNALGCLGKGFDVVTEELLLSCTVRQTGEFATADRIRKGNYQALVVPYAPLVTRSLLVFLEKIATKGTTLVFIDEAPKGTCEDGITVNVTQRIARLIAPRRENVYVMPASDLEIALANIKPEATLVRESGESPDTAMQVYHGEGGRLYVLHNVHDTAEQTLIAEIQPDKFYAAVDPITGEITEIEPVEIERSAVRLRITLSPLQTAFILAASAKITGNPKPPEREEFNPFTLPPRSYRIIFKEQWEFEPLSLNVLPLTAWSTKMGMSRLSGQITHLYETVFEAKEPIPKCVFVLDGLSKSSAPQQGLEVMFNGVRIDDILRKNPAETAFGPDCLPIKIFGPRALTFDISGRVMRGLNRISVRTTGSAIDPQTLIYPPIIIGDFAVAKGGHGLAADKHPLMAGHDSWTLHGYPFMTGRAKYCQTFEVPNEYDKLVLRFSKVSGTVYAKINDVDVGVLHWPPMELDVTKYCNVQRNRLEVEVVNNIDNVLNLNGKLSGLTGEVYIDVYKG
ncbi:MAG: hypothetical protein FWB85_08910 [Chitinispirillia bacterium]|nr:hypothetical protein [Chitinispirillia bacterium]MCL2242344.1 hypothetical protein [Chitinispirillia bacterium]